MLSSWCMGARWAPGLHLLVVSAFHVRSLTHNGLSVVRVRGSTHPCGNIQNMVKWKSEKGEGESLRENPRANGVAEWEASWPTGWVVGFVEAKHPWRCWGAWVCNTHPWSMWALGSVRAVEGSMGARVAIEIEVVVFVGLLRAADGSMMRAVDAGLMKEADDGSMKGAPLMAQWDPLMARWEPLMAQWREALMARWANKPR